MKLLQHADSSKLHIKLFLILAAVFVLPIDAFADGTDALEGITEWFFLLVGIIIFPPIFALLMIISFRKEPGTALYLTSVIWLCTFVVFYVFFKNTFKEVSFWVDYFWLWIPVTILEVFAIIQYIDYRVKTEKNP